MRIGSAVAAALVLTTPATSALATTTSPKTSSVQLQPPRIGDGVALSMTQNLALGADRVKAGQFQAAFDVLRPAIDTEAFATLEPKLRRASLYLTGVAALRIEHFKEAHDLLRQSSAMAEAEGWDWLMRVPAALGDDDSDDAVLAFETLVARYPQMLANVQDGGVSDLCARSLRLPRGEIRQMALMDALLKADWGPEDPQTDWSAAWATHAGRLLDRGDQDRAALAARRVTAPDQIVGMRADRRFAALVARDPSHFDVRAAQTRDLARRQAAAKANPASLKDANAVAWALLGMRRADEVLRLTQHLLEQRDRGVFTDPEVAKGPRHPRVRLRGHSRSSPTACWRRR